MKALFHDSVQLTPGMAVPLLYHMQLPEETLLPHNASNNVMNPVISGSLQRNLYTKNNALLDRLQDQKALKTTLIFPYYEH
jgi:hypothetical protein